MVCRTCQDSAGTALRVKPPWVSGNRDSCSRKVCRSIRLFECDGAHVYGLTGKMRWVFLPRSVPGGGCAAQEPGVFDRSPGSMPGPGKPLLDAVVGGEFDQDWQVLVFFAQPGGRGSCWSSICIVCGFSHLGSIPDWNDMRKTDRQKKAIQTGRERGFSGGSR